MAKVITDSKHYENIADAIRAKNGEVTEYYPSQMADAINEIIIPDTLVTASGDIAAIRSTEVAYTPLTATANDIRIGTTAITEEGTITGTKEIPAYHAVEGHKIITAGKEFKFALTLSDLYDYTKLQCIICPFDTSIAQSVSAEKVAIENNVYEVNSTIVVSTITKDATNKSIDFGFTNNTSNRYVIRFFTYKEIY